MSEELNHSRNQLSWDQKSSQKFPRGGCQSRCYSDSPVWFRYTTRPHLRKGQTTYHTSAETFGPMRLACPESGVWGHNL